MVGTLNLTDVAVVQARAEDFGQHAGRLAFDLETLDAGERALWLDLARSASLHREMFISVYPGAGGELERDHALLAKFGQVPAAHLPVPERWSLKLEFIEV